MTPSTLSGIGVSSGLAVGPAIVLRRVLPEIPDRVVADGEVEAEVARLREAVEAVRGGLQHLRERTAERAGPEEAAIFDAQILMLQDAEFLGEVESLIRENQLAAERAFEFKALEVRGQWANSASQTLRERVADLTGMQLRVLEHLLGESMDEPFGVDGRPAVLCVRELTPGLTVEFDRVRVI
ncbi:MAG: phosphoenolpyruvate-utilizing N-terminal domain-containing protein, partial [Gemmatimonadales bacterium]